MIKVNFKEVSLQDENIYVFTDSNGNTYQLYIDSRAKSIEGLSPDFWDKFYFSEKITVDYKSEEHARIITKILSY